MSVVESEVAGVLGRRWSQVTSTQEHARSVLTDRLVSDFAAIPPARIAALVDAAYARTGGARVQSFRTLLAERDVRAALKARPQEGI